MASQPNIVLIECDSMDGRVMGCMDHPAMTRATPNLDRLAARGALFRNAYTNNPVCCPSRASMWSGTYTHQCEGWNNHKGLSPDDPTFRTRLGEAGYRSVTYGKTDYLSGHHTIRARVSPWTRSAYIPRPEYRMEGPRIIEEDVERLHEHDWDNVDRSVDWLHEQATGGNAPFMLYLGLNLPHPAFTTSTHWLSAIDQEAVDLPQPDERDHPAMAYQRFHKNWMHGFSDDVVRDVRRIYFAMIAELDAMVGTVIQAVDDLGLTDETVILFIGDHGELAMEHRQFYKMSMYEPSVRVPVIAAGPGVRSGTIVDDLISLIDIYPTLMDVAGADHPPELEGRSLSPLLAGERDPGRPDWVLSEFHGSTLPTGAFMLRRDQWKYVAYVGYPPQLFNLAEDPDELDDLAAARPDVVAAMDASLREIVDYEAVDARVKAYDKQSFRTWRAARRSEGTYEDLMARVYSGWDDLSEDEIQPWRATDEALIDAWLNRS
jgi:arylsulfatase K